MASEFQKQKIDRIYEVLDVEGTGALTFQSFLADAERGALRMHADPEQARRTMETIRPGIETLWDWMTRFDRNADGEVTPDEFRHGYGDIVLRDPAGFENVIMSGAEAWFTTGDANGDGVLSREEYTAFFGASLGLTSREAERGFDSMVANGTDALTRERYKEMVRDYYLGDDEDSPSALFLGRLKGPGDG
ncbi:hypothetical protein R6V09_14775 [Streptomyces sp. W16]|uniref:EF-hand domain-containing protein n=1 Tax=Streptomyces sp. W16 TaxID=3076631 RepID=UPI00295BC433|nr:hypothetical protein [Streptomyces sp. W16]MDV9171380.1 hypothetical protein [Streptomyces sp. W16]